MLPNSLTNALSASALLPALGCLLLLLSAGCSSSKPQSPPGASDTAATTDAAGQAGTTAADEVAPASGAPVPAQLDLKLDELGVVLKRGTPWRQDGTHPFLEKAVVDFGRVFKVKSVKTSLDNNDAYLFEFLKGDKPVGSAEIGPSAELNEGLEEYVVELSPELAGKEVDSLVITQKSGDGVLSIGHLILVE